MTMASILQYFLSLVTNFKYNRIVGYNKNLMLMFKNCELGQALCTTCFISWIQARLLWKEESQLRKKKKKKRLPVGKLTCEGPAHWKHATLGRWYWGGVRKQTE